MAVYKINPLEDSRWAEFGRLHPRFSVFHTTHWLEALHRTYGYAPVVYTTSPPGTALANGIAFCRISSWLTGRRLVSLPFADHCDPLVENSLESDEIFVSLHSALEEDKLKYVEVRPRCHALPSEGQMQQSDSYCFHVLDLRPSLPDLFRGLQKDSTQRKIRRAQREGLRYEIGRSAALLSEFYRLCCLTRRRHNVPPQPLQWFRNLLSSFGDRIAIHAVFKGQRAIATILTLRYGRTLVYKYGCSDARFHNLGGMPLLFWNAIQHAKEYGLEEFDLGRSDSDNQGLITFKRHLGAAQSMLIYRRRYAARQRAVAAERGRAIAQRLIGHLPDVLLTAAGRLLYKHVG